MEKGFGRESHDPNSEAARVAQDLMKKLSPAEQKALAETMIKNLDVIADAAEKTSDQTKRQSE